MTTLWITEDKPTSLHHQASLGGVDSLPREQDGDEASQSQRFGAAKSLTPTFSKRNMSRENT